MTDRPDGRPPELPDIPRDPYLPTFDREASTMRPGSAPPVEPTDFEIVSAVRHAVRQEIDPIRGAVAEVNRKASATHARLDTVLEGQGKHETDISLIQHQIHNVAQELHIFARRIEDQIDAIKEDIIALKTRIDLLEIEDIDGG